MNMKTRRQVAEYLLSEGAPLNLVRAAVNESYNYDCDVPSECDQAPGLIRGQDERDLSIATEVTKEQAMMMFTTMEDMMVITKDGIELDGELLYDLNGYHLEYNSKAYLP